MRTVTNEISVEAVQQQYTTRVQLYDIRTGMHVRY